MKFVLFLLLFTAGLARSQTEVPATAENAQDGPPVFSKLWIRTEIVPMNFAWQDLELTREASFTGPISGAWKKWATENLPSTVGEVDICSSDCVNFSEQWESTPRLEVLSSPSPLYGGGIWLLTVIKVWKHLEGTEGPFYQWEGRTVLIDINTKRVMANLPLGPYRRSFSGLEGSGLNSALGNQIYRSPLALFKQLMQVLAKGVRLDRALRVKVTGHRHILDALELMRLMQTRGTHLGLEPGLLGFSKTEAYFLCFFQGEEKSFTDLLSRLKEVKSSKSYNLVIRSEGQEAVIQMVAR